VGPRAGLDGCGKSRPPPGFDLRTVQHVVSRYTDYAIPTPYRVRRIQSNIVMVTFKDKKHAYFQCSMNVIMPCFASSRGTMSKANHSAIQKGLTQTAVCIYLEKCKTEEKCKQHKIRVSFSLKPFSTSGRRTAFTIGAPHRCQCPGILLVRSRRCKN
jgi:hypothetical protein